MSPTFHLEVLVEERSAEALLIHLLPKLLGDDTACDIRVYNGKQDFLKMLPGVERPAIASFLPTQRGRTVMLDLGANVNCRPEHLVQFAIMGSALVGAIDHNDRPSIGLLNIGEEEIKGNDVVKEAAEMLRASSLNFYGNVEGDDIYKGTTDLVVCDGFVGNVALKTSEGLAQMLAAYLREEFTRNPLSKLAALLALPVIKRFKHRVDHHRDNGASLRGLRGVVVNSHGSADPVGFEFGIQRASDEARNGLLDPIRAPLHSQPFDRTQPVVRHGLLSVFPLIEERNGAVEQTIFDASA